MNRRIHTLVAAVLGLVALTHTASAQWTSEDYPLVAGWNAIWLSHDASHEPIGDLVPASVEEIWRWNPAASATQFTQSPSDPVQPDTQWLVWKNGFPVDSTMTSFAPNAAYLVKVADGTANFTLQLTGQPVPPRYTWKSSGLNFFGFPAHATVPPNFETYFSLTPEVNTSEIFKYDGGPITANPVPVNAPLFEPVRRGSAYWIRSSQFSDFYGPLRVTLASDGLAFGDTGTVLTLKVKNVTAIAITATLTPAASAAPPAGQTASAGGVPLRLRGAIDPLTGQFIYTDFVAATPLALAPGEEREIVFAVDRAAMAGAPGDTFQSLLQVTDSENLTLVELPVSAVTTSPSGLWAGAAVVTTVDQITAAPGPLLPDGQGTVTETTDADADAPSAFPIRLILHRDDSAAVKLLQQVYIGQDAGGSPIVTAAESLLDAGKLASARRLSSSAFPLDAKIAATGADLGLSGTAAFSVALAHDAATNPFVHTYHPDHDNKDAQFSATPLAAGKESYVVTRTIDLEFTADPTSLGLSDLGWGSTVLGGTYRETISGLRAQDITIRGSFVLRRVSDIATLTE